MQHQQHAAEDALTLHGFEEKIIWKKFSFPLATSSRLSGSVRLGREAWVLRTYHRRGQQNRRMRGHDYFDFWCAS